MAESYVAYVEIKFLSVLGMKPGNHMVDADRKASHGFAASKTRRSAKFIKQPEDN
jgi:hypothetical protein